MKKISLLLTFALVLSLAAPAFAAEDNFKITGKVTTVFETANYGDDKEQAAEFFADDSVLDKDLPEYKKDEAGKIKTDDDGNKEVDKKDAASFPAKKAFYQKIALGIEGNVSDVKFDLDLKALKNVFTETDGYEYEGAKLGEQKDTSELKLDKSLLTLEVNGVTVKLGDLADYHADSTFINKKSREGIEVSTEVAQLDVTAFALGNNGDKEEDFYGVTAKKELDNVTVTGKVLQASKFAVDHDGKKDTDKVAYNVRNVVLDAKAGVTDKVTVNGKVALNDWENDNTKKGDKDTFIALGTEVEVTEKIKVNADYSKAGEKYVAVLDDVVDAARTRIKLGGEYALNEDNTVKASYTTESTDKKKDDKDKGTVKLSLDNTMGDFTNTASLELVSNHEFEKDHSLIDIELGTEYAMSEATTVKANFTKEIVENKSDKSEWSLNYLKAGIDHEVSENIEWNTEVKFLTGENKGENDTKKADANALTTKLIVKF